MRRGSCPKCASASVIESAEVLAAAEGGEVQVAVARKPEAFLLRKLQRSPLVAWVCGECGYTELYALHSRKLLQAAAERDDE